MAGRLQNDFGIDVSGVTKGDFKGLEKLADEAHTQSLSTLQKDLQMLKKQSKKVYLILDLLQTWLIILELLVQTIWLVLL